ncbi:hypothetical protein GCM10007923_50250 [Shinella yambaruensis]|uniref:Uncharacterized protein n=1 Tax=Shinella yambaruensis TaxID=415996 RepID=A0ABQ5ZPX8_9HYPH|nr:hypothetical protein GCM10007923_50250 [Shinella yambaruensis]
MVVPTRLAKRTRAGELSPARLECVAVGDPEASVSLIMGAFSWFLKLSWEAAAVYYANRAVSETTKVRRPAKNRTFRALEALPAFTRGLRPWARLPVPL